MTIKTKSKGKSKRKSRRTKRQLPVQYKMVIPKDSILYKQKEELHYELRPQFEWFSEIPNYGTSYGTHTDQYKVIKNVVLFDLGKGRTWLMNHYFDTADGDVCDEQYSGSAANMKFHKSIEEFLNRHGFHGTIVRNPTDDLDCGPSEIVFTPRTMKTEIRMGRHLAKVST